MKKFVYLFYEALEFIDKFTSEKRVEDIVNNTIVKINDRYYSIIEVKVVLSINEEISNYIVSVAPILKPNLGFDIET